MCPAFVAPVLVPEGSELSIKFGTNVDGVQRYSLVELLALRPFVKNIAALPELLDKRTDPAKVTFITFPNPLFVAFLTIFF